MWISKKEYKAILDRISWVERNNSDIKQRCEILEKRLNETPIRGIGYALPEIDALIFGRLEALKDFLGVNWEKSSVVEPSYITPQPRYIEKEICVEK